MNDQNWAEDSVNRFGETFITLAKKFKDTTIFSVYLVFNNIMNVLWPILYAIGQILIAASAPILNK